MRLHCACALFSPTPCTLHTPLPACQVWSATAYDFLGRHEGHKEAVTCLALDSNFLFSGSEDCSIHVWDCVPSAQASSKQGAGGASGLGGVGGGTRCGPCLGGLVMSCCLDGLLRVTG